MNQAVLEKAKELAQLLAKSPEYIAMRATEDAAAQDAAMAELVGRYNELHEEIERVSLDKNPDFDKMGELTREMETVQEQVQTMPMAQAMQSARQNFTNLMQAVNAELSKVLNPNASCSGDCSGNCAACGSHCHE